MTNKIYWKKCTPEFFEAHLDKIETTKFDPYNLWTFAVWSLKSLHLSKSSVENWSRRSSKFEQKAFDNVWNAPGKGNDDFEKCAKWFAKEAGIPLPQVENKPFDFADVPEYTILGGYKFNKINSSYKPLKVELTGKPDFDRIDKVMHKLYGYKKHLAIIVNDIRNTEDESGNYTWQLPNVTEIVKFASDIKNNNIFPEKRMYF